MIQYKQLKKGDPYVFFEQNLAVEILDVLEYDYNNIHNVGRRPFHALSYRFDADSTIISDRNKFQVKKGTLAYFPANCPYCRIFLHKPRVYKFTSRHFFACIVEQFFPNLLQTICFPCIISIH